MHHILPLLGIRSEAFMDTSMVMALLMGVVVGLVPYCVWKFNVWF